jgi:hypothetical protein
MNIDLYTLENIAEDMLNGDEIMLKYLYEILEKCEGKEIKPFEFSKKESVQAEGSIGGRIFKVSVNDLEKFTEWFNSLDLEKHEQWLDKFLDTDHVYETVYNCRIHDSKELKERFNKYDELEIVLASKKYLKERFDMGWFLDIDVFSIVTKAKDGGGFGDSDPAYGILYILENEFLEE